MSVNKVILIGNLGADPKTTYVKEGTAVSTFSLATTERGYTAKNGTAIPDRTEWHNVVLWRGLAEVAEKYLRKGSKVYIEGKLRTRSYEDSQGTLRYVTEVVADSMEMLSSPVQQSSQSATQASCSSGCSSFCSSTGSATGMSQSTASPQPARPAQPTPQQAQFNYSTDDLPF